MVHIKVNGTYYRLKAGISILEACKLIGITIPRFCFSEMLSISGNCRMCLVELENLEKPVAACVTLIEEGQSIWVNSPFVKKARENVLETILLNHPLDCPICDQGGECDLQEQVLAFGGVYSRYYYKKTSVSDKYCGPLIKTIMTRCITCTRCVRFSSEIAGVDYFGTLNRGNGTEIGAYVQSFFDSEISSNVVDLCPVGALTSKEYAFKARPWELRYVESVDTTDALGSNVYVNYKGTEVLRVIPKNAKTVSNGIISDKARYSFDANKTNRLVWPFIQENGEFTNDFDHQRMDGIVDMLISDNQKINVFIDETCDVESYLFLTEMAKSLKNVRVINVDSTTNSDNESNSNSFNLLNEIDNASLDFIYMLGANTKLENAVLNARLRLKYLQSTSIFLNSNLVAKSNFPVNFVSAGSKAVASLCAGKGKKTLFNTSSNMLFVIGNSFKQNLTNFSNFQKVLLNKFKSSKLFNLHLQINTEGANLLGSSTVPFNVDSLAIANFFVGLKDSINIRKLVKNSAPTLYNFWLNSFGGYNCKHCDYILPVATDFETSNTYLTLEGKFVQTSRSLSVKEKFVSKTYSLLKGLFNYVLILRQFIESPRYKASGDSIFAYKYLSVFFEDDFVNNRVLLNWSKYSKYNVSNNIKSNIISGISNYPLKGLVYDFYSTTNFTRHSKVMLNCSVEKVSQTSNFF